LRRESSLLPFTANFVIFDADDQETWPSGRSKTSTSTIRCSARLPLLSAHLGSQDNLVLPNDSLPAATG